MIKNDKKMKNKMIKKCLKNDKNMKNKMIKKNE